MDEVFEIYKKSLLENIQKVQGFEVTENNQIQFKESNYNDAN